TAATASLLLIGLALPSHGAEPAAANERDALRARVNAAPLDWVARYNLGLAEAQAGDRGRALGETVAALAQSPGQEPVRANARSLAAAVPGADAALAPLRDGHLAPLAAPASWQLILIAGAVFAATGIAIARRRSSAVLIAAGGVLIVAAGLALREQGVFADRRVALVASATVLHALPTDAEATAEAPPLAVGSAVLAEGDFLGWTRVTRADGGVGWVRGAALVSLYGARAAPRASGAATT
ncbi:MAG TPA: hypothetical protein VL049_27195, partial [Candidatus Dormibacteraeota bacterium]|nr:hypothetical protein [Candidatus Dormibacteraeota bacterium]